MGEIFATFQHYHFFPLLKILQEDNLLCKSHPMTREIWSHWSGKQTQKHKVFLMKHYKILAESTKSIKSNITFTIFNYILTQKIQAFLLIWTIQWKSIEFFPFNYRNLFLDTIFSLGIVVTSNVYVIASWFWLIFLFLMSILSSCILFIQSNNLI